MNWKELYKNCNNKKYSAVTNIKQPAVLKSTFSIFLDKYKYAILISTILLAVLVLMTYRLNFQVFLCILAILALLIVALIYYNTYKVEIKNDKLFINIMFRKIEISINDLATIYISKQESNLLAIVPFNYYSINIVYSDNNEIKGYSLSTTTARKNDIKKFFEKYEFIELKQQEEEEKKDNLFDGIKGIVKGFVIIIFIIFFIITLF